jgi:tRNA(fMet)-specific endonuclease VapC
LAAIATVELCLDTNILIDFLKNRGPGATALEKALSDYRCGVSHITNCYMGMAHIRYFVGEELMADTLIVLLLDHAASAVATQLHADLVHTNQGLSGPKLT